MEAATVVQLGCLTDDEVLDYLNGRPADELRVKRHMDACPACREALVLARTRAPVRVEAMAAAFEAGAVLAGKYRVERPLGVGGMGQVVAARHIELGTRVAIKLMLPDLTIDHDAMQRFAREARAAARLTGDHVVRVVDVGRLESGIPFMVMEYLEGHDLARVVAERGALPVAEAVAHMLDVCEAVAEAHRAGIIHRDLKPKNIFLAELGAERRIKVLDFGLAKTFTTHSGAESGLTRTHAMMGSPHYMSPEQIQSARSVDARSDVWALGACLHELLAARPPFVAPNVQLLCARILLEAPAPLDAPVPRDVAAIVSRCLERNPERRFQTVDELAAALRAVRPAAAPRRRARRALGVAAASLLVSAAAIASLRDSRAPTTTPAPPPLAAVETAPLATTQDDPVPPPTTTVPAPASTPTARTSRVRHPAPPPVPPPIGPQPAPTPSNGLTSDRHG